MFEAAVLIAAAAAGGEIAIPAIIKSLGGAALELANAVCDPPSAIDFLLLSQ